jgi:large subunit ribosomal protein L13
MKKPINPQTPKNQAPIVISARGKVLGRLATEVATILRGKDSVFFQDYLLSGRPVVVTHAKDIVITGNKLDQKMYYRHSGYIGNLKEQTMRDKMKTKPGDVIRHAVRGMLPKNRLQKHWLAALEIREEDA